MEKFQYGQQVTFQVEEVLDSFLTEKTHVKYLRTLHHGNVLLMDDEVQFSTLDERRYHDTLVNKNIPLGRNILILGGGDGLALRNVYENNSKVQQAVVVDWDSKFIEVFSLNYNLNSGSLRDPRTVLVYMDAVKFLNACSQKFDTIIVDLPDPDGREMEDLYFQIFGSIGKVLQPFGNVLTHLGPVSLCNKHPCWTVIKKVNEIMNEFEPTFYTQYIPSFSHEWAFMCYSKHTMYHRAPPDILDIYLRLV